MKHSWTITFSLFLLSILSLFNLLSSSVSSEGILSPNDVFWKQLMFIIAGWIIYWASTRINTVIFKYPQTQVIIYVFTILLLIATLLWGPLINNTKRWIIIAGVQLQPSEVAKLVIILFTAYIFTLRKKYSDIVLMLIVLTLLLPILALIYIQPHGSMSIIIIATWALTMFTVMKNQLRNAFLVLIMLCGVASVLFLSFQMIIPGVVVLILGLILYIFGFYSKNDWKKLLTGAFVLGISLGLIVAFAWNVILLDYQKNRINAFFNPTETSQDIGFNVDQSKVAIGSGQLFGKGWGFGTQSKLRFLPEFQTDFIFAAFSEEFGFVGSLGLLILYLSIVLRLYFIALRFTHSNFEYIFVTGLAIKFAVEIFINVGTNTGLIPATGIPLPIMSAGGTNILITFFSLGLVQGIIATNTNVLKDSSYVIDNEDVLI